MNIRILIAAFVAAILSFFGGWIVFGMLLADFMGQSSVAYEGLIKDPPVLWAIFLGGFSVFLLGAIIFEKWAKIRSFKNGLIAGLWIGLLNFIFIDLYYYAFMDLYSPTLIVVDIVVNTLLFGLWGGVIGAILGIREGLKQIEI